MYTLVHYLFSTAQLCDLQHLGRATSQARGPVLVLCHCLPRRNSAACIDAAACRLLAHTYLVSLWVSATVAFANSTHACFPPCAPTCVEVLYGPVIQCSSHVWLGVCYLC